MTSLTEIPAVVKIMPGLLLKHLFYDLLPSKSQNYVTMMAVTLPCIVTITGKIDRYMGVTFHDVLILRQDSIVVIMFGVCVGSRFAK